MTARCVTESIVEQAAGARLEAPDYAVLQSPVIEPIESTAKRAIVWIM